MFSRTQIAKEIEKEKKSIKQYEEILNQRELRRKEEEDIRLSRMARMAAVAEQQHQAGLFEDVEVERKAAEVQSMRERSVFIPYLTASWSSEFRAVRMAL